MNRDFEFRQILRAFRNGIINEATFEAEMASLERGAPTSNGGSVAGGGFKAFGRSYRSERAAIVSFLDKVRAGEANGGEAFSAWAEVCKTDCLRAGLRMVAEREAYHSRVFGQRVLELGGEHRAVVSDEGRKFTAYLGNPGVPDNEKLLRFVQNVGSPDEAIRPICDFAALVKDDVMTKEALRLFAEDELSTTKWLYEACALLNADVATSSKAPPQ
jgi:hypothetical protein